MRTYGQYCPIARAAEILAERWTPIILRNMLLGATTFGEIAEGAPGISRTLLAYRLRELEDAGVIERTGAPRARDSRYGLTKAGRDLNAVMLAMGTWGERWMEMTPRHTDPGVVLDSWRRWYLALERLPDRRVVTRFDFPDQPKKIEQLWMIFDGEAHRGLQVQPGVRRGPRRHRQFAGALRMAPGPVGMGRRPALGADRRRRVAVARASAAEVEPPQRLGAPPDHADDGVSGPGSSAQLLRGNIQYSVNERQRPSSSNSSSQLL